LFAGAGAPDSNGDGGPAILATFRSINAIVTNTTDDVFVSDPQSHRIRKVSSADGTIHTVAGGGSPGFAGDGGPATSALFSNPREIAADFAGNVFIADTDNNRIRKILPDGTVTTIAGNGIKGFAGDGGPATSAALNGPHDIAVDTSGDVYFVDSNNNRVRKIGLDGTISTIAGNGSSLFSGDGGPATAAGMSPLGLAVDVNGNVYVGDNSGWRVRRVGTDGVINTIAGNGSLGSGGDGGPATSAQLNTIWMLGLDSTGNLYISSAVGPFSFPIRKVAPDGTISTVSSSSYFIGLDATDRLLSSNFCSIGALAAPGEISFFAGINACGISGDGGPAAIAEIFALSIAADPAGNIFLSDPAHHVIRKLIPVPDGSFNLTTRPPEIWVYPNNFFPPSLSVNLEGNGTTTWTIVKGANSNFFTIDKTTGTGSSVINVASNAAGLAGGFYLSSLTVSSPQAVNGSVIVPVNLRIDNPSATLTSANPPTVVADTSAVPITLAGTNFVSGAVAQIGQTVLNTTFVSPTQLTVVIPTSMVPPGSYTLSVFNPGPGGGSSDGIPFNVTTEPSKRRRGQVTSQ
jgi:hypothetical protein